MKIEIYGTGCAKCRKLYQMVTETVKEMGVQAEVVKIEDLQAMMDKGVMITPALFINGEAVSAGRVPKKEEIVRMIKGDDN
ncbi:MAG: TM0996/MTH895 family glutaredoxin-like protein [Methanomassiliicoccales archaeon]|nr:MAG: TM0996/MTH895 family glutaredoxin-like protein [Methanomassiliicoccales archaeon]